jgi:hypothetical protein
MRHENVSICLFCVSFRLICWFVLTLTTSFLPRLLFPPSLNTTSRHLYGPFRRVHTIGNPFEGRAQHEAFRRRIAIRSEERADGRNRGIPSQQKPRWPDSRVSADPWLCRAGPRLCLHGGRGPSECFPDVRRRYRS